MVPIVVGQGHYVERFQFIVMWEIIICRYWKWDKIKFNSVIISMLLHGPQGVAQYSVRNYVRVVFHWSDNNSVSPSRCCSSGLPFELLPRRRESMTPRTKLESFPLDTCVAKFHSLHRLVSFERTFHRVQSQADGSRARCQPARQPDSSECWSIAPAVTNTPNFNSQNSRLLSERGDDSLYSRSFRAPFRPLCSKLLQVSIYRNPVSDVVI